MGAARVDMLSRIANSLFWMGRYLERAENTARYAKVHFFSSLDAPLAQKKEFVLDSILSMTGLQDVYNEKHTELIDEAVIHLITLDSSNPVSIKSSVNYARENARGARDVLSLELWEAINKFYHMVNSYSEQDLQRDGIYNFTEKIGEKCSIVNGYIDNTLLHNEVWSLIHLGIHIERASQITRTILSKVKDLQKVEQQKLGKSIENYQCVTLLKSAEAFDMSRTHYKAPANLRNTIEFLIMNRDFPRSICYNLVEINTCLNKINPLKGQEKGSLEFLVGKICSSYNYLTIEEIEKDLFLFLNETLTNIYNIGELLEKKYLTY